MTRKEKIASLKTYLDTLYPTTEVFLHSNNEYEFLIAVILSAQAQDKVVNQVTPVLFDKYHSLEELKNASYHDVLTIIKRVGLGPSKAKNIIELASVLVDEYQSKVPHDINKLEKLPGVGHKTASVFLGEIDNAQLIPVDTHIIRLNRRLGILKGTDDPKKIQECLQKNYQGTDHMNFHRQMILFGRNICLASNKRNCAECKLNFCSEDLKKLAAK